MDDHSSAPRPDPIDDVADEVHTRFGALEDRLKNIETSVAHIARVLSERLPPPGATDDLASELTMERGNRRSLEARVEQLEGKLDAIKRFLRIEFR